MGTRKSAAVPTKLYIGNLPDMCRQEDLQAKFEKYGNVVEFDILKNYGFVHYESREEARAAADALNGTEFGGSTMTVEVSHSRVRQKPGMGEKGGCYRCGQEGHWSKDCPRLGPRRPRPPPGPYRDPYDDPYYPDPYDPYYRSRYYLPPPPGYSRYDPYYDPYDRRPLPLPPRDPYYRERLAAADPYERTSAADPYARSSAADPYARSSAADPYARTSAADPYGTTSAADLYARESDYYARKSPSATTTSASDKDPYARDGYPPTARDPYAEYYERRR
ncbi:hypothetical protein BaRGS_00032529, partial [Batillaria attramentaria]